jgi:hypothetical protein
VCACVIAYMCECVSVCVCACVSVCECMGGLSVWVVVWSWGGWRGGRGWRVNGVREGVCVDGVDGDGDGDGDGDCDCDGQFCALVLLLSRLAF